MRLDTLRKLCDFHGMEIVARNKAKQIMVSDSEAAEIDAAIKRDGSSTFSNWARVILLHEARRNPNAGDKS
jgi:hypothetical protein